MKKILKVGFDLDGVILYNPIRFIRPIAKIFKPLKSILLKQDLSSFYFPRTKIEQFLFSILHKTSFRPDFGLEELRKLVNDKKIKAYLITGRYSFLKKDYQNWLNKIQANKIFTECFQNEDDLQPNKFKELMIKKLDLDVYVEDNWDIVRKIKNQKSKIKIFWLTNILDKNIPYKYKFNNLKEALRELVR